MKDNLSQEPTAIELIMELIPDQDRNKVEAILCDYTAHQLTIDIRRYFIREDVIAEAIDRALYITFGYTREQLSTKSRKWELTRPRQMAMTVIVIYTKLPLDRIGALFNRNHATVINARGFVQTKREKGNQRITNDFNRLKTAYFKCREEVEAEMNIKTTLNGNN